MNAYMIENMVKDRIREIEADVTKNQYSKKIRCGKVDQSEMITHIVKWIRTIQMVINLKYTFRKYTCR